MTTEAIQDTEKIDKHNLKGRQVSFTLSVDDYEVLKSAADAVNLPVIVYVKQVIRHKVGLSSVFGVGK